jgi:hypothetical protein
MNEEMKNHLSIQETKKMHIQQLETILMTEHDYQIFLDKIKEEDQRLYELSQKFADLTAEAKKVLDEIKNKSKERQSQHGVEGVDVKNHHRILPREIKEKLLDTAKEVDNLHLSFDKFTLQTQHAVLSLHESQERVLKLRKDASVSGNENVF